MKNIAIIVLCITVATLLWLLARKDLKRPERIETLGSAEMEAKEISRQKDSLGIEHVIYKESEPIIKTIELVVEDKAKVDSLMNVVGIQGNQLKSITNAFGRVEEENVKLKKRSIDTLYRYSDRFLTLSFYPKNDTLALADFGYNFDFNSVSYDPRKWYQKIYDWNDVTYTNTWSNDKRAKIRGYEKLTVAKPRSTFGFDVNASSIYMPHTNDVGFGGKIDLRVKRITASGSYMYFPSEKEWYPVFGIDISLGGKN